MKLWIIAASLLSLGWAVKIEIPPRNLTTEVGVDVNLTCGVSGDVTENRLKWTEQISSFTPKTIFHSGMEGPNDPEDYAIDGKYHLIIKDIQLEDGGIYTCLLDDLDDEIYMASVVVVEDPGINLPLSELHEGQEVQLGCEVRFSGAPGSLLSPSQRPVLLAMVGEQEVSGTVTFIKGSLPTDEFRPSEMSMSINYTVRAEDHGQEFRCIVETRQPAAGKVGSAVQLDIKYSLKKVEILNKKAKYYIGDSIECSASANPAPTYYWSPVTSGRKDGVSGRVLNITAAMTGRNEWECKATVGDGQNSTQSVTFMFEVAETSTPSSAWRNTACSLLTLLIVLLLEICQ